jgi:ABC-type ATPase involved in cell division
MRRPRTPVTKLLITANVLAFVCEVARIGPALLVTHDQDLLEEVGTRVWQFEGGRITDFKGSYEEFAGATA